MKKVSTISIDELKKMSSRMYEPLVKAVVDVARREVVVDAEMHVDEEQYLLEHGSQQADLWGINLYPEEYGRDSFIEFDSMINLRPRVGNFSRSVDNPDIQHQIREIIAKVVYD